MNKNEIFKILDKYNLNKNEFVIISGAAMVIRNYKEETRDIDISVSKEYYEELLKKYDCKFECVVDNVKIWFIDDIINFSTNFYNSEYTEINGYKIQTKESIIKLKEKLARKKDFKDIEKIKEKETERLIALIEILKELFENCDIYVDSTNIKDEKFKEKLASIKEIKIDLTEDITMAFDREYANGFYKPVWDEIVNNFKKIIKENNYNWHMPDPFTIEIIL